MKMLLLSVIVLLATVATSTEARAPVVAVNAPAEPLFAGLSSLQCDGVLCPHGCCTGHPTWVCCPNLEYCASSLANCPP
jgi:hypothetical protein